MIIDKERLKLINSVAGKFKLLKFPERLTKENLGLDIKNMQNEKCRVLSMNYDINTVHGYPALTIKFLLIGTDWGNETWMFRFSERIDI